MPHVWTRVDPAAADWDRFAQREVDGAVQAAAATTAGVLAVPVRLSGSVQAGLVSTAGQIEVGIRVLAGAVAAQAATTAGVLTDPTARVQGAVQAQAATADGSVRNARLVQGAVQAQAAEACAAVCIQDRTVTGAVQAQAATTAGSIGEVSANVVLEDTGAALENDETSSRDVSVSIGSGTNRKIIVFGGYEETGEGAWGTTSATFDPGGADETAGTQLTGAQDNRNDALYTDGFFIDIDDAVSAGTYTVRFSDTVSHRRLGIGVYVLSSAASGQREALEITKAGGTSVDSSITTLTNGAMVVEGLYFNEDDPGLSADDGQTQRYHITTSQSQIAGGSNSVPSAGTTGTGWSFGKSMGLIQTAVSIAPAAATGPARTVTGPVQAQSATAAGSVNVNVGDSLLLTSGDNLLLVSGDRLLLVD